MTRKDGDEVEPLRYGHNRKLLDWARLGASRALWLYLGVLAALPPLFVLGLLLPGSGEWSALGAQILAGGALLGGCVAVAAVGVPGLVLLHLCHMEGFRPRAILGAITGVAACAVCVVVFAVGARPGMWPVRLLFFSFGAACGLLGAWVYWMGESRIRANRGPAGQ